MAVILSAAGISASVLLGSWFIADAVRAPIAQTFPPERKVEPDPQPIEEEVDPAERKVDADPTPVGGHTPRVVRL